MATVINRLTNVGHVNASFGIPSGQANTAFVAQTFKAAGSVLNSVEFLIDGDVKDFGGATILKYRVLITTVDGTGNAVKPKTVLFESAVLSEPIDDNHVFHQVKVDTGALGLVDGQTYAIVLEALASSGEPTSGSPPHVGSFLATSYKNGAGSDYLEGHVLYYVSTVPRAEAFAAEDWQDYNDQDMSFRLVFSNPGIVITGTKKNDKVDATHTVKGQPLPGAKDDAITGKKGNDKLSGLAGDDTIDGGPGKDKLKGGDGDDLLIGGKDKDTLFGDAGKDIFLFDVSLKEAPDRIKAFVPADDTIHLDATIFGVFTQGAVAAGSFHIGNKAADADDYLVYNPGSGALLYDSDGAGGNKGIKFAVLDKNLAMTSADFAVV
jgi:Ca2+-binding RTX toxin-like protein